MSWVRTKNLEKRLSDFIRTNWDTNFDPAIPAIVTNPDDPNAYNGIFWDLRQVGSYSIVFEYIGDRPGTNSNDPFYDLGATSQELQILLNIKIYAIPLHEEGQKKPAVLDIMAELVDKIISENPEGLAVHGVNFMFISNSHPVPPGDNSDQWQYNINVQCNVFKVNINP